MDDKTTSTAEIIDWETEAIKSSKRLGELKHLNEVMQEINRQYCEKNKELRAENRMLQWKLAVATNKLNNPKEVE
jgi:hypothetical protein